MSTNNIQTALDDAIEFAFARYAHQHGLKRADRLASLQAQAELTDFPIIELLAREPVQHSDAPLVTAELSARHPLIHPKLQAALEAAAAGLPWKKAFGKQEHSPVVFVPLPMASGEPGRMVPVMDPAGHAIGHIIFINEMEILLADVFARLHMNHLPEIDDCLSTHFHRVREKFAPPNDIQAIDDLLNYTGGALWSSYYTDLQFLEDCSGDFYSQFFIDFIVRFYIDSGAFDKIFPAQSIHDWLLSMYRLDAVDFYEHYIPHYTVFFRTYLMDIISHELGHVVDNHPSNTDSYLCHDLGLDEMGISPSFFWEMEADAFFLRWVSDNPNNHVSQKDLISVAFDAQSLASQVRLTLIDIFIYQHLGRETEHTEDFLQFLGLLDIIKSDEKLPANFLSGTATQYERDYIRRTCSIRLISHLYPSIEYAKRVMSGALQCFLRPFYLHCLLSDADYANKLSDMTIEFHPFGSDCEELRRLRIYHAMTRAERDIIRSYAEQCAENPLASMHNILVEHPDKDELAARMASMFRDDRS